MPLLKPGNPNPYSRLGLPHTLVFESYSIMLRCTCSQCIDAQSRGDSAYVHPPPSIEGGAAEKGR